MNPLIVLQQMLLLTAMIAAGYLSARRGYIREKGRQELSALIVHILNPLLILSSVSGPVSDEVRSLIPDGLLSVLFYFLFLTAAGLIYYHVRRCDVNVRLRHQLLILFSNVGFFGIPLVRSLLGEEYVIFVALFILGFNLLVYTYGVFLAGKMRGESFSYDLKKIVNGGTIMSLAALIVFLFKIQIPAPVLGFCKTMGDACIPLSMMVIGATIETTGLSQVIQNKENWILTLVKMLLIPAVGISLFKLLPIDPAVRAVAFLILCMPGGSITGMLCEEYGSHAEEVHQCTVLTTLFCALSLPLLSFIM